MKNFASSPARAAVVLVLSLFFVACDMKSSIQANTSEPGAAGVIVSKIRPIEAKPLEIVSIEGDNFSALTDLRARIELSDGGRVESPISVIDSSRATFVMPEGAGLGLKPLLIVEGESTELASLYLVANTTENNLPILIDEPSEICNTKRYIDRNGDTQTGTKDCGVSASDLANLTAENIKAGVSINGVTGTLAAAPADCSSNGQTGCVTTSAYKAADLTNLDEGNVKNGVTIAGTLGKYPNATYPLAGSSGTDLVSSTFDAQLKSSSAFQYFGSDGTRYTGAGDTDLGAANIKSGVIIHGVTGTLAVAPADCLSNGQTGCVTTSAYKAADLTNLDEGNIKNGVTIAGTLGKYPNATYSLTGSSGTDLVSSTFDTQLKSSSAFQYFGSDGTRYTGAGDTDLGAANIKSGVIIHGVTGTFPGAPADCSSNGQTGCVTTSDYKAANLTNLDEGNIKNGVTIAGTLGKYPNATYPLAGSSGTDLVSSTFDAQLKSSSAFQYFGSDGTRYTGAGDTDLGAANIKSGVIIHGVTGTFPGAPADCSSNGQTGCVTTSDYKAANLTNLDEGNIKNGVTIAGTLGKYPNATYSLTGSSGTDLTSSTFDAQIKSSSTFQYFGSDGTRYTGTGDTDITAANIADGVYIFGATGTLVGPVAPDPWNVRVGVTINGVSGKLKTTCRNNVTATTFDIDSGQAATLDNATERLTIPSHGLTNATPVRITYSTQPGNLYGYSVYYTKSIDANTIELYTSSALTTLRTFTSDGANVRVHKSQASPQALDVWDTIDDYNNGTAGIPASLVSGWTSDTTCSGVESSSGDANVWKDVTTAADGSASDCAATSSRCTMKDKITSLWWSKLQSTSSSWWQAVSTCASLNHNGQTGWRLPSEKELLEGNIHGIRSAGTTNWITSAQMYPTGFWSATTASYGVDSAWAVTLANGYNSASDKGDAKQVVCVR